MELITVKNTSSIIYSKPLRYNNISKIKSHVLSNDILIKPVIKTPIINTVLNWKDVNKILISIIMEPLVGPIYDFLNIIEDIEEASYKELEKRFTNFKFKSNVSNANIIDDDSEDGEEHALKFQCNANTDINIYDENGSIINKDKICDKKLNYIFMIEFTEVWYDITKMLGGCNFNIVQAKVLTNYYDTNLFDNNEKQKDKIVQKIPPPPVPCKKPPPPKPIANDTKTDTTFEIVKPNPEELLAAKNKLRKAL